MYFTLNNLEMPPYYKEWVLISWNKDSSYHQAGEALNSIVSAIAEEINRNINNIRQISDQAADATQETTASSAELAGLAEELQDWVSTFRV